MALNNTPQSGQNLAQTRPLIQNNFNVISTAFVVDHVDYNIAGQGWHKKVTFPAQVAAPAFTGTNDGLYELPYNNQTTTLNELFIHKQTSAGTADIPFTASILSQNSAVAANGNGWTYLPSGLIMRWENAVAINGLTTVTLGAGYPAFAAILSVQVTPIGNPSTLVSFVNILSPTQFRLYSAAATTCNILIIGR